MRRKPAARPARGSSARSRQAGTTFAAPWTSDLAGCCTARRAASLGPCPLARAHCAPPSRHQPLHINRWSTYVHTDEAKAATRIEPRTHRALITAGRPRPLSPHPLWTRRLQLPPHSAFTSARQRSLVRQSRASTLIHTIATTLPPSPYPSLKGYIVTVLHSCPSSGRFSLPNIPTGPGVSKFHPGYSRDGIAADPLDCIPFLHQVRARAGEAVASSSLSHVAEKAHQPRTHTEYRHHRSTSPVFQKQSC